MNTFTLAMHMPFPKKPAANRCCTGVGRLSSAAAAAASLGSFSLQCSSVQTTTTTATTTTPRRSGNYKPPLWDFNYIQSLTTQYTEEKYSRRSGELIGQVKMLLLQQQMEVVSCLELIDDLQRLGVCYHFRHEINQILNSVYQQFIITYHQHDLYTTALAFRLLRDHGFRVSQGVFDCFKNEKGEFRSSLSNDTRGMLQLYEASFLLTEGEGSLELAKEFATNFLNRKLELDEEIGENLSASIRQALELPIHWRIQRPNARWFIDAYGRTPQMNPILLELSKLDFNLLQAIHQQELALLSRWWKETRLADALPFARDRVVENYFWTLGGLFQPEYGYSRMMATKVNVLITIIDDIFDVYATWEELQLFNSVIQRWDVEAMEQLPHYMQMCFLTLNNLVNEMAYHVLREQGILIIKYLRKSWIDLFTTYTQEAKWYAMEYTPTLNEYMSNASISISAPVILTHAFFLITNPIENDVVQSLYKYHDLVRYSAMLLRIANDLGTSPYEMERGDVPKSVQCYMKETGASREEAGEHVKRMIWETWKKMNEERVGDSGFSKEFMRSAVDLGRMAQYMYQFGDGHGIQNPQIKDQISSVLFEPIV